VAGGEADPAVGGVTRSIEYDGQAFVLDKASKDATRVRRQTDLEEKIAASRDKAPERKFRWLDRLSHEAPQGEGTRSPLARGVRPVEMVVDFRAVGGAFETRAKEFDLVKRDRGSIKPAHEFRSRAPLARTAFGEKHAVSADAGIETLLCRVDSIQDFLERIAQLDACFGIERGNCVQHRIDRIVLPKEFFTLRGDAKHDRALVFVRRLSDQVCLFFESLYDLGRGSPGGADKAGQCRWSP